MFSEILKNLRGSCLITASGRFPERILNTASKMMIYAENVKKDNDGNLSFSVSRKGAKLLLSSVPEGLKAEITQRSGLPFFLYRYRKRVLLFFTPAVVIASLFVFSLFVWNVEISGGDKELRESVKAFLNENGVKKGSLRSRIDQYEIKRSAICAIDDLSWLWVDLRGTTAFVKINKRTAVPKIENINEPADVIAIEDCVIEEMQVFRGRACKEVGNTAEKGSVIITGTIHNDNEAVPDYHHHACGIVKGRVWREESVTVPKTELIKKPTGNEKNVYGIKFKKNIINFSLNSGISYKEYDKIKKEFQIPFFPISFSRVTYCEVNVEEKEVDTQKEIEKLREAFSEKLIKKNAEIKNMDTSVEDNGMNLSVKFTAQCIVRIDKEIPVNTEENDGENL